MEWCPSKLADRDGGVGLPDMAGWDGPVDGHPEVLLALVCNCGGGALPRVASAARAVGDGPESTPLRANDVTVSRVSMVCW